MKGIEKEIVKIMEDLEEPLSPGDAESECYLEYNKAAREISDLIDQKVKEALIDENERYNKLYWCGSVGHLRFKNRIEELSD